MPPKRNKNKKQSGAKKAPKESKNFGPKPSAAVHETYGFHPRVIDDEQRAKLSQFKARVDAAPQLRNKYTENDCLRFLIARQFDIEKAL